MAEGWQNRLVRLLEGRLVVGPSRRVTTVTVGLRIVRGKPHNGMLCIAAMERQGEEHACRRVRHPLDAQDEPSTERAYVSRESFSPKGARKRRADAGRIRGQVRPPYSGRLRLPGHKGASTESMKSFRGSLLEGEGLPARPPCFPESGRISCPCGASMNKFECGARRRFWLHAKTIADMPNDAARREYMLSIGKEDRWALGRAAQQLIAECA